MDKIYFWIVLECQVKYCESADNGLIKYIKWLIINVDQR